MMMVECFKCTVKMDPIAIGRDTYTCSSCGEVFYQTDIEMWLDRESYRHEHAPAKHGPKVAVQLHLFSKALVHAHISREIGEPYEPEQPVHEWARRKQWREER